MRISDWSSDVCSSDLDKLDRRRVLTAVTVAAAVAAVLAGAVSDGPALVLYAMMFLLGGMSLPMYSLCIAHTNDYLTPKQMVAASGTLMLVGGTGAVLGPVAVSLLMRQMGPVGFFAWAPPVPPAICTFSPYRLTPATRNQA